MTEAEAVEQFKPYVMRIAKKFERSGVAREDLIQEGLIAVALAYRQWRPDGGRSFRNWIRRPVHYAMLKTVQEQRSRGGAFHGWLGGRSRGVGIVSMDGELTAGNEGSQGDDERSFHDVLGSFEEPKDSLALEKLPALVSMLNQRGRQVIRLRFEEELTYEEIGARLGITREGARRAERAALAKLKALARFKGSDES